MEERRDLHEIQLNEPSDKDNNGNLNSFNSILGSESDEYYDWMSIHH